MDTTVYELREGTPEEIAQLEQLVRQVLGYMALDSAQFSERVNQMLRHPDYHIFAAKRGDKLVAFAGTVTGIAFELEMGFLRIIALAVREDCQRQGVGSLLLSHIKEYARAHDLGFLAVNSGSERTDAHRFYENNGFVKKSFGFFCAV